MLDLRPYLQQIFEGDLPVGAGSTPEEVNQWFAEAGGYADPRTSLLHSRPQQMNYFENSYPGSGIPTQKLSPEGPVAPTQVEQEIANEPRIRGGGVPTQRLSRLYEEPKTQPLNRGFGYEEPQTGLLPGRFPRPVTQYGPEEFSDLAEWGPREESQFLAFNKGPAGFLNASRMGRAVNSSPLGRLVSRLSSITGQPFEKIAEAIAKNPRLAGALKIGGKVAGPVGILASLYGLAKSGDPMNQRMEEGNLGSFGGDASRALSNALTLGMFEPAVSYSTGGVPSSDDRFFQFVRKGLHNANLARQGEGGVGAYQGAVEKLRRSLTDQGFSPLEIASFMAQASSGASSLPKTSQQIHYSLNPRSSAEGAALRDWLSQSSLNTAVREEGL